MQLNCKRCQHTWHYRGHKQPNRDYPLYVTCPRCRTVVKLESKTPLDESGSPEPLASRGQQQRSPSVQAREDRW